MMIFYFVMCVFSVVYLINRVSTNLKRVFVSFKLVLLVSIVMEVFIGTMMLCLVYMSYKEIVGV
ncbi:hypothetical protein bcgnr5380_56330 [Bacillus cereus]